MASLETEHTFTASRKKVFKGLCNYSLYSKYLPGVTNVEILPAELEGSSHQIRYDLKLIKNFYYILDMYEEEPNKISWTLSDSNLMKKNNGSWELTPDGRSKTHASYKLDIKFKGLVPSKVVDTITQANLPKMFEWFQQIIDRTK